MQGEGAQGEAAAEWFPLDALVAWPRNPKDITPADVADVVASMRELGFGAPLLARRANRMVIAGHVRQLAARRVGYQLVPVRFMDLDEHEAERLALLDNSLGAKWDSEKLARLLAEWQARDLRTSGLGFSEAEVRKLIGGHQLSRPPRNVAEVEPVEPPKDAVSRLGECYQLGPHRLVCGDSTDPAVVALALDGLGQVDCLHADPPYGMGKEADGVANDNLYDDKLDAFQMAWWRAWRPRLKDNSSAYVWGTAPDLFRLWYRADGLAASERLTLKNEVVWDKGAGSGMGSATHRMFATATERALFFMLGQQEMGNVNKDAYWEGWEPIRAYLDTERAKMGWSTADVNRMTGTRMAGHWFTKSQWTMPTEEHYRTLQEAAKGRAFLRPYTSANEEYSGLRISYDGILEEFKSGRCYFDGAHDTMTDVWRFPRVLGEERFGHATPKPVAMIARCLKSSTPKGGLVAEPFGGTGTTLIAAAETGRVCATVELEPRWCDAIRRRWGAWAKASGAEPGSGALT